MSAEDLGLRQQTENGISSLRFYTIDAVARIFDVSPRTVRRWIKDELLRAHPIGRILRISHDDLVAFIEQHRGSNDSQPLGVLSHPVSGLRDIGKTSIK